MAFISYLQSFLNFVPVSSKSAFISSIITLWMAILSCCANASIVQFWPLSLGQARPGVGNLRGRSLKRKGTEGLLGARKQGRARREGGKGLGVRLGQGFLPPRASFAFLSRLKLPFPSLSNAGHAGQGERDPLSRRCKTQGRGQNLTKSSLGTFLFSLLVFLGSLFNWVPGALRLRAVLVPAAFFYPCWVFFYSTSSAHQLSTCQP